MNCKTNFLVANLNKTADEHNISEIVLLCLGLNIRPTANKYVEIVDIGFFM